MAKSSMTALVHYALKPGAVELREVPRPAELADDEVLLAPGAVSVCGSDLHQYHNTQSWPVRVPVILGHEFCGSIVQVGKAVRGFREGDLVTSETAARICGQCLCCRSGLYNLCPERLGFGYGLNGAMADCVAVPARCLHHVPDSVPFEKAALTEPCCVAYNAVCVQSRVRPGDSVLVFGPGPIGLLCLALAKLSGAGWLAMAGLPEDAARLCVAKQLGADALITVGSDGGGGSREHLELARRQNKGLGVDLVVDATGFSASLQSALAVVRPGGQITKVGWGPQPLGFSLDPLVHKGIRLQGTFSHNFPIWESVLGLLGCGKLDPAPLIGRVAGLSAWQSCFEEMGSRKIIKAVLIPGQS
jgi:alcohol dehydrogenase/L-iditol 2-dehydrogenase